jgi:hypothetical protein
MKKNSKKFLLCFGLALIGNYTQAQGLEGIVVEKFYQANAADATNSSDQGASPLLTSGAVTYRIYVNMAAGYKFSQIYGTATSPLQVSTTTNFYNDPNSGSTTNPSSISVLNTRKNTALLDSWFTTGGVAAGKLGVLKSEDTDGSLGNVQGILQNNPGGLFGLPINIGTATSMSAADGMITGTVVAPNVLGISETVELDALNAGTGNNFIATNGAIAALGGVVGPTASNMVLVGQFTTSGVLSYHFNVQLVRISDNAAENYFAVPTGPELTHPSLNLVPNVAPSVSITSPSNGANIITGTALTLEATSADTDGTVSSVEFFVDGVSVGTDVSSPYTAPYTALVGAHTITAKSTDNSGDFTISSGVAISVANNQAPTVSVSAVANAIVGDVVAISATAADVDGTVAQVEFFVDNVSVGVDLAAAYTQNWTSVVGTHTFKAVATDNLGLTTTSSTISILVAANTPPSAALTSPASGASFVAPSVITIAGTATDTDGTITLVEFLVNNVVVGTSTTAPYSFDWTSTFGIKTFNLRSTDNKGAVSTSAGVTLTVADPSALPYEIGTVIQTCNPTTFCVPLAAAVTNTVDNVKGYDLVLNYDKTKITPTGNITLFNNLINSSFVETDNSIDAINGTMNISVSFKSTAPLNSEFNGVGNILCVEFTKTANFMPVDTAIVSMPFLQESYITGVAQKAVSAGKAITYRDQNFPGVLKFWSDNSPIKYNSALPNDYLVTTVQGADVATSVLNPNNVKVSPNLTGNFTYNLENGVGININRDIDNANMVQILVNGADAAFAKTLIINGAFTPSIYQLLACDVNRDGVVSAGDVSQMKQRSTNVLPEFQQAWNYNNAGVSNGQPSKDWYFVDSLTVKNNPNYQISATFPANDGVGFSKARVPVVPFVLATTVADYVNCPVITSETYKGIMVGDVDGSYAAFTNDGLLKSATTSTNNKVVFDLEKAVRNGNTIDVPVSIISDEPVVALDFAFQFNEDKFVFNTVESKSDEIDGMSHYDAKNKFVRYTSDNLSKFNLNTEVVTIRFDVIDGEISEEDIKSTLGILNGKQVDVEFRSTSINTSANTSVSVYPNPTTGLLNILVSENSIVQLLDLSGKEVLVQSTAAANVKQELNVENLSGGVYILKVYNENFNSIERVVLNK